MENNTAKHFVLQLGSLITLYLSVSFLLVLLFGLINLIYPDAAEGYWAIESASSSVRMGIAMVIVFFPTYLILTRIVNKNRRATADNAYLSLTKWLIYLSLLVGGIAILVDLVIVIMAFLEGEITERFILKAGAVLFVVGAAVYYYLLDAKGYWMKEEKKSVSFAIGMGAVVIAALAAGFMRIETPSEVREVNLDEAQVMELQNIQFQIESYISLHKEAPLSLEAMVEETKIPVMDAPEGRDAYTYEKTESGFKLCATFAKASDRNEFMNTYIDETALIKNRDNWAHGMGEYCFERVINKQ